MANQVGLLNTKSTVFGVLLEALQGQTVDWLQCDQTILEPMLAEHRLGQYLLSENISDAKMLLPWLKSQCQQQKQYALKLTAETLRISQKIENLDVQVICLKGCALSQLLYGDPAYRYFRDIDLLIHPKDFMRCHAMLCQEGYKPLERFEGRVHKLLKWRKDCVYQHVQSGCILELHWRLTENIHWSNPAFLALWQRRQAVKVAGKTIFTLGWEDLVLHQVVHGANHMWCRLQWLLDMKHCVSDPQIDWEIVQCRAKEERLLIPLGCAMYLLQQVFALQLPRVNIPPISVSMQQILSQSLVVRESNLGQQLAKRWLQMRFFWQVCPLWAFRMRKWYALITARALWLGF